MFLYAASYTPRYYLIRIQQGKQRAALPNDPLPSRRPQNELNEGEREISACDCPAGRGPHAGRAARCQEGCEKDCKSQLRLLNGRQDKQRQKGSKATRQGKVKAKGSRCACCDTRVFHESPVCMPRPRPRW